MWEHTSSQGFVEYQAKILGKTIPSNFDKLGANAINMGWVLKPQSFTNKLPVSSQLKGMNPTVTLSTG